MTKKIIILISLLSSAHLLSQELILDDGIYIEKPNFGDTVQHKYSKDNISYKVNMVLIYDYYYMDNSGIKKKFLLTKDQGAVDNPLNLTSFENPSDNALDKIKIEVNDYSEVFTGNDSNYTQTVFGYSYLKKNGRQSDTLCEYTKRKSSKSNMPCSDEMTGIIDNKKNLWMHPPRTHTFKILQLNPFPFYYLDESVKSWSWNLETGGFYLDPRWINHRNLIKIRFEYLRQKDEIIETPLGKIYCKVTNGTGTSEFDNTLMKTHLKSYYNPKYGFVRLEYTNINGSKIFIQLIDIK